MTHLDKACSGKISVAVLGATGSVGQRFIEMLSNHPWYDLIAVAASERTVGRRYGDAVRWLLPGKIPENVTSLKIDSCQPNLPCEVVFSALDSSVAGEIEEQFAQAGYLVISNAKNHRMRDDVPLIVPEVNPSHLDLLEKQTYRKGRIITNPNCSTIGLAMALKPLHDAFGIESIHVVTMQAISGAGYPGVASMDIMDNIIPYIEGEEQKIETELLKIFGSLSNGKMEHASFNVSAQCNRVAVSDGHTACVSVKFKTRPERDDLIKAWKGYSGLPQHLSLPSAPLEPIHYQEGETYPQPKLHRSIDKGMAVSVGRLRECPLFDYKFVVLSHNTIRGAAGGALLCAELHHSS